MLERVKRMLNERKGGWRQIAQQCDVSYSWLSKLAQGVITNPTHSRLERLDEYLRATQ